MTQQQTQPISTSETGPGPAGAGAAPAWPRLVVIAAGFAAGGVAQYALGQDSFWPVLLGGMIVAAMAGAADVALTRVAGSTGRRVQVGQVVAVAALAIGVALFYRSQRDAAFGEAFGMTPPAGVSHTDVERLVARDTGRKLVIVQFEATRAGLDALVAARKFAPDKNATIKPGKEAKSQRKVWDRAFDRYGLSVEDRWKSRLPVLDPVIYHWTGTERETLGEQTSVLWDAASGRGCAIHASP